MSSHNDKPITAFHTPAPPHRLRLSFFCAFAIALLSAATAIAKQGGWDFETYHVQILLAIDAPGGVAEQLTNDLPRYLQDRVETSLIPAWSCNVHLATRAQRVRTFANIDASSTVPPPDLPNDQDKRLLVTVRWTPEYTELTAREFDRFIQHWGAPIRRESRQDEALPEQVFALIWQTFSPLAQLEPDPKDPQRVVLKPRGALLPRAAGAPPLARPGDVFQPMLRRTTRSGELEKDGIQNVPWTYIEAAEVKGDAIIGRVQSASRHPFAARRQGRIEQLAVALRADPDATVLRLHSRTAADKPLSGYEVFSQNPGEEALSRIGLSDTAGELSIPPGKTRIQFLFVKHGGQLLARVPVAAGAEQRVDVPLPDDDTRLTAEVRLSAIREDLIDVVARRNILIARARQKIKKKDFKAAEELLRTLDDLPARPQFDLTLKTAAASLRSNDPQMQRRIDQLFNATKTLFAQYLDLRPINQVKDELREAENPTATQAAKIASAPRPDSAAVPAQLPTKPPAETASSSGEAGSAAIEGWTRVQHGNFSVEMPASPTKSSEPFSTPAGPGNMTKYALQTETQGYLFIVAVAPVPIPNDQVDSTLAAGRDAAVSRFPFQRVSLSSTRINVKGNPAMEFVYHGLVTTPGGSAKSPVVCYGRYIVAGNKFVSLAVFGLASEVDQEAANRYWGTFSIDEPGQAK